MEKPVCVSKSKCFEGSVEFYKHFSESCQLEMKFSVYLPKKSETQRLPVLYFLAGLTSSEENFIVKGGAQKYADKHGIILVCPDTSHRGANIPGEGDSWDFGLGAGYYVNATEEPWSKNYRMYDYVALELPKILQNHFPALEGASSITGFSMGGHGAIVLGLTQPGKYRSVSAFSPISAPSQCPWGVNAFTKFLGTDRSTWKRYDSNELVKNPEIRVPLLVDQGTADKFLEDQLLTHTLEASCKEVNYPLTLRWRDGYDHSYYFIASFIEEHIEYHAKFLNG